MMRATEENTDVPVNFLSRILVEDRRDVEKVTNSFTAACLNNDIELSSKFKIYFYEFIG